MNYKSIAVCRTSLTNRFIVFNHLIVFKVLLIYIIYETIVVDCQPKPIRNLQTFEDNSERPVFRVIINSDGKSLIVGGRNVIYKLSAEDLHKMDELETGPVEDSIDCSPPGSSRDCPSNTKLVNNDNKILLLYKQRNNYILILACGDVHQGRCMLLKPNEIKTNKTIGNMDDPLSYVASKTSGFALFAPSPTNDRDVLYVAQAYDHRPLNLSPPAISSRIVSLDGIRLTHSSGTSYTKVDIHKNFKQSFDVKYIYGFNYSQYTYFLSNQPMSLRDGAEYEAKLIRICHKDNEFFSYSEIPITCESDINDKHIVHTVATTAYFGKVGQNLYKRFQIRDEQDSDTLFVSMGVPLMGGTDRLNATFGTSVCGFPITQINKAFNDAAEQCFRGENHVRPLEVIKGHRELCSILKLPVEQGFCGTGMNPYIGTDRPLNGTFLSLIKGYVTSLAVAIQRGHTVAAIGTNDGWIKKIKLDTKQSADKPIFQMNIADLSEQSNDRSIRPNPAFDKDHMFLYILSGHTVVKFPFGSCSLHTDCSSCLDPEIDDPLNCGWCDSHCATDAECMTPTMMSRVRCPPEIHDFWPTSGPTSGGTIITIIGDNLGKQSGSPENSNINVSIGGIEECEIKEWQPRRVQCQTKRVIKEYSGNITVTVQDFAHDFKNHRYDINGSATTTKPFEFVEPTLMGVYPSFGPIDGGTNVTIIGKNLHIGSNRTILLAGVECKETQSNTSFLSCVSGRQMRPTDDTSVQLYIDWADLIINQNKTIDNTKSIYTGDAPAVKDEFSSVEWSEYFQYKPNPRIDSFGPTATIKSGNTSIMVTGSNLDSVANPKIVVTTLSDLTKQEVVTEGKCQVRNSGNQMICWTPPIRDPIHPPTRQVPVVSKLSFVLDGVKNYSSAVMKSPHITRLVYFPDPTYHKWKEPQTVYLEEPILKIEGRDLTSDYPIDIRISDKYKVPCNTTESKSIDAIYCLITYHDQLFKDNGQEHKVIIRVGRISFSPGSIKFSAKPSHASVGAIVASTLIPVFIIFALAVVVMYYLKKKGYILKEKQPIGDWTVSYNPEDPDHRPPYSAQSSTNPYEDHGVTRPLLPVRRYQVSEETMNLLRAESILIERSNITLEQVLGQGQFGCVYKGILHQPDKEVDRDVALKTLQSSVIRDEMDVESFLQEGLIMKDFKHHHVLTLIGVSFEEDGSPIVVLPFMENGDLLSYIRNEQNNPTVKNLLMFAIDIAKGMDYLSGQKFVHRDLAARNCMLDKDLCAKVADFGLSRDIYEREYYSSDNKKCKLPVKWMAPESLEKGTYNTKTDVWSYGVLVWELLTRGVTPYPDVDNWEILNYLKQGRRMPRPAFCPEALYFILLRCWSDDPKQRPLFAELVDEVQTLITRLEKSAEKQRVELDKCNTYINFPVANVYYNQQLGQQSQESTSQSETLSEAKPSAPYETTC